jgi:hypothetical protein
MKIKPKYLLNVRPDANGDYPEAVARRLIRAGLAVEIKDDKKDFRQKGK